LMAGASSYGVANVKVRVSKAQLLTSATYAKLILCHDTRSIVLQLQESIYSKYLVGIDPQTVTPRKLIWKIRQRVPEKFEIIRDNLPQRSQYFIDLIFSWYELINLKTVLRGINFSGDWNTIKHLLVPMGKYKSLPFELMVASGSIDNAILMIKDSKYYTTLMTAKHRFLLEETLFPIEVLLDLEYWQKVWDEIENLPDIDQKAVRPIITRIIERNDLIWAARYRFFYHLTESEIINYTLGIGTKVNDSIIRQVAQGKRLAEVIGEIYPNLTGKVSSAQGEGQQLSLWEIELTREIARVCSSTFSAQPFSLAPALAYILILEYEIQDLVLLIEAKASGVTSENYQPYLINQGYN